MSKAHHKLDNILSMQGELFDTGISEGSLDISLGFRQLMSTMIRESRKDRYQIAMEISMLTGREMTKEMLDKYTSSDPAYRFPAESLPAFCQATCSVVLGDYLFNPLGMHLIGPQEMKFVELSRLEESKRHLEQQIAEQRAKCGLNK